MIERRWKREQAGEYLYIVGGVVAGGVVRQPDGLWGWYAEPSMAAKGAVTFSSVGTWYLASAKAAVVRALGGES